MQAGKHKILFEVLRLLLEPTMQQTEEMMKKYALPGKQTDFPALGLI